MKRSNLKELWNIADQKLRTKHLIIVCNTKSIANPEDNLGNFHMDTEYFSDDEFDQVISMFSSIGIETDIFTYEDDFFKYVIDNSPKDLLVYNSAQSGRGPGRKSLVPAFCNLHAIPCTGSNAYVVSLCRHKYHVNQLLAQAGIQVPKTWLYSREWLSGRHPSRGTKLLIKPIYESASIGIDRSSIQFYNENFNSLIHKRMEQQHQPMIAQEFIAGYEVEVPIVRVDQAIYNLPPVGIAIDEMNCMADNVLDYERIYFDHYRFYDFSEVMSDIAPALSDCATTVAKILGMEGLCRVDFRIKCDGSFFVTDVSTNPHFIAHSSVNYSFKRAGLRPEDIAKTILSAALVKG